MLVNGSNKLCLFPSNHTKLLIVLNFMANFASYILLLFMRYFPPLHKYVTVNVITTIGIYFVSDMILKKFHLNLKVMYGYWIKTRAIDKIISIQFEVNFKTHIHHRSDFYVYFFFPSRKFTVTWSRGWKAKHFYGWRILSLESINILTWRVSMSILFKSKKVS